MDGKLLRRNTNHIRPAVVDIPAPSSPVNGDKNPSSAGEQLQPSSFHMKVPQSTSSHNIVNRDESLLQRTKKWSDCKTDSKVKFIMFILLKKKKFVLI